MMHYYDMRNPFFHAVPYRLSYSIVLSVYVIPQHHYGLYSLLMNLLLNLFGPSSFLATEW